MQLEDPHGQCQAGIPRNSQESSGSTHLLSLEPCQAVDTGISLKEKEGEVGTFPKSFPPSAAPENPQGRGGNSWKRSLERVLNPALLNPALLNPWGVLTVLPLGPVFPGDPWKKEKVGSARRRAASPAATSLSPELSPCLL